jgi:hypothetical protein
MGEQDSVSLGTAQSATLQVKLKDGSTIKEIPFEFTVTEPICERMRLLPTEPLNKMQMVTGNSPEAQS